MSRVYWESFLGDGVTDTFTLGEFPNADTVRYWTPLAVGASCVAELGGTQVRITPAPKDGQRFYLEYEVGT